MIMNVSTTRNAVL